MTKEQRDLAWKCLPKEVREEIKRIYNKELDANAKGNETAQVVCATLLNIFNAHNLTSDTELSELLFVEREKVQEIYQENLIEQHSDSHIQIGVLYELFGNKCLPDKEPSVQVEPKFKVGDKVKIWINSYGKVYDGIIKTIKSVRLNNDNVFVYSFFDYDLELDEHHLEPYTEPKTKDNMEELFKCGDIAYLDNRPYKIIRVNKFGVKLLKEGQTWYTRNSLSKEKELNLCELLKGCVGEAFYSPAFSVVTLKVIRDDRDKKPLYWEGGVSLFYTYTDGRIYSDSFPTIFPSRALYEKYPLDPKKAWMEWKSERTPKRWRANVGGVYWRINVIGDVLVTNEYNTDVDNDCYNFGNYFRTKEEAQQAAEAVRECLDKFHEQNSKK